MLVRVVVVGGLIWQPQRHPDTPPGASGVATSLMQGLRQTTYRSAGSVGEARAWHRESLGGRGWSYCGTQETAGCTNMVAPIDGSGAEIDVYRQTGDTGTGTPSEVWPHSSETGAT